MVGGQLMDSLHTTTKIKQIRLKRITICCSHNVRNVVNIGKAYYDCRMKYHQEK